MLALLNDVLAIWSPLRFQMHFRMGFSISGENTIGILIGFHWFCRFLWAVDILTVWSLPVHAHVMCFHLLMSSLLCFSNVLQSVCVLSRVQCFATSWTVACQAPLSMGLSWQESWSGLPFPPGNLPNPGIKPVSPASPALADGFFTTEPPGECVFSLPVLDYLKT